MVGDFATETVDFAKRVGAGSDRRFRGGWFCGTVEVGKLGGQAAPGFLGWKERCGRLEYRR